MANIIVVSDISSDFISLEKKYLSKEIKDSSHNLSCYYPKWNLDIFAEIDSSDILIASLCHEPTDSWVLLALGYAYGEHKFCWANYSSRVPHTRTFLPQEIISAYTYTPEQVTDLLRLLSNINFSRVDNLMIQGLNEIARQFSSPLHEQVRS